MNDKHPIIALFEAKARVLEVTSDNENLDDAISRLAGWIELKQRTLSEDDMTTLSDIGAILFRDGLNRRMKQG